MEIELKGMKEGAVTVVGSRPTTNKSIIPWLVGD